MPVKGLVPGFISLGNVKTGGKGKMITSKKGKDFKPPEKWDHFKITTNEKTAEGDFVIDEKLMDKIGGSKTGLQEIPCRVLYNDIDLIFPTRYACYVSGRLICSGDGEKAESMGKSIDCPCDRLKSGYIGSDKCKLNGILSIIIDGLDMFGGCHIFRTTSKNTCKSILGSIQAIKAVTGGLIAQLPLCLTIQPKNTITPQGKKTVVYVVSLIYKGSMQNLQAKALEMMKDQQTYYNNMKMIESNAPVMFDNENESDIIEEFYPDAIQIEAPKEPKSDKVAEMSEKGIEKNEPFGGQKDKIQKIYMSVILEDVESWEKFLDENSISFDRKKIIEICKGKGFDNHEIWIDEFKKAGIINDEFLQKIQYEMHTRTGRSRWNAALEAHGVCKASELNKINVESFIRQVTDIPF